MNGLLSSVVRQHCSALKITKRLRITRSNCTATAHSNCSTSLRHNYLLWKEIASKDKASGASLGPCETHEVCWRFLSSLSVPLCTCTGWWRWLCTMETCTLDTLWLTAALRLLPRARSLSAISGYGFQTIRFAKLACRRSLPLVLTCCSMSVFTQGYSTRVWSWGLKSD